MFGGRFTVTRVMAIIPAPELLIIAPASKQRVITGFAVKRVSTFIADDGIVTGIATHIVWARCERPAHASRQKVWRNGVIPGGSKNIRHNGRSSQGKSGGRTARHAQHQGWVSIPGCGDAWWVKAFPRLGKRAALAGKDLVRSGWRLLPLSSEIATQGA
jgi:hypothetical protein